MILPKIRAAASVWTITGAVLAIRASAAFAGSEIFAHEEIVVTARRLPQTAGEVGASFSIVGAEEIHAARPTVNLDEALTRVPGVLVQNSGNFAQDARLQIRGFGTRAAFGIREIRVLVDGLPYTLADGQSQLDEIDLDAVDRIEILRGPASALYGNAAGGVIQLFTPDPPRQPTLATRLTGGSYGLGKFVAKGGGSTDGARLSVHASHLRLGGYRDHSETEASIVNAKLEIDAPADTEMTFILNAVDSPEADDPGALTRTEAEDDPRQANPNNVRFDAGESVQQGRLGWMFERDRGPNQLFGYAYVLYRDFENSLAFEDGGIVTFDRVSPGGGLRYARFFSLFDFESTFSMGLDVQHIDDGRRRFDNLQGDRGALVLDQTERVTSFGPYVQHSVEVTDQIELTAGARYDRVHYDVDVGFDASGNDNSGSKSFDAWSPAGAIRYSPLDWTSLFFSVGTAFQVPTTTELAIPDRSGLDPDLEPQSAISYEAGVRIDRHPGLTTGLTGFWIDIDDELIPFETEPGRTDFRNAGSSRRYGVELDWQAQLLERLRWSGAFTWIEAEFSDYRVSESRVFDGNQEPGIPSWQIFLELLYRHPIGAFAALETFIVDDYYVDDANDNESRSYELVNLRAGWSGEWGRWQLSPFIGLSNLTDADYDGTVRLNARGGRFFEPAPGFNVFGGVSVSATL